MTTWVRLVALVAAVGAAGCRARAPGVEAPAPSFLQKPSPDAVRIVAWNIGADSVFPQPGQAVDSAASNRPAQFARVVRALEPDVLCLLEARIGAARAAALADEMLPLADGRSWEAHAEFDTIVISRFGITARSGGTVDNGSRRRGHALVVTDVARDAGSKPLFLACAHFDSGSFPENISLRARQSDAIIETIRDAKAGRGPIPLQPRTPFVILGDLNAIARLAGFVDDLLAGRASSGPPVSGTRGLDWDDTRLTDARPRHNRDTADSYTWRNDLDVYPPAALDRFLYSDSVLEAANAFVLDSTTMPYEALRVAGLRAIDVMRDPQAGFHDHFPVVVDVRFK